MNAFIENRRRFIEALPSGCIAIIEAAPPSVRSHDTHYVYRPQSNFYYLTGFKEPHAVLVVKKDAQNRAKTMVFVHPKDPAKEMWEGAVLGVEAAIWHLGVDEAYSIEALQTQALALLKSTQTLFAAFPTIPLWASQALSTALEGKEAHLFPTRIESVDALVFSLRRIKTPYEIATIKKALEVTQKAHLAAMAASNPASYEYEIQAVIEYIFKKHGATGDAYTSIVAGGNSANTLHYIANDKKFCDGDLVLIDAGCESDYYASDITRTFPVNGRFTKAQKKVYEIVLHTQKEVISRIKPGVLRSELSRLAIELLSTGLIDLKILKAPLETVIEKELYKPYYPHGIGHYMGLDVHDPIAYKDAQGIEYPLQVGEILTIEPGLYLPMGDKKVPKTYQGIGIRIEDDVLVTATGHEILSATIPKEILDIERACEGSVYDFI